MTVTAAGGRWVLPPGRVLWVPPGVEHAIRTTGAVRLRTIRREPQLLPSITTRSSATGRMPRRYLEGLAG